MLRGAAVALYAASFVCLAAGQHDAFDLLLMGASMATLASVATDPKVRQIGQGRRLRQKRFFDARREGHSAPQAWAESDTPTDGAVPRG